MATSRKQDPPQDDVAELRARVAALSMAIDEMQNGLCMFDPEGRITVCNARYAEAIGLTPEQVRPGMTSRDVIEAMLENGHRPGESADQIQQELDETFAADDGTPVYLKRPDGVTFAIRHTRTKDDYWIATYADITKQLGARRRAKEALKDGEERFRLAADAAKFGVWDYDTSLKRREWSDQLYKLLGFDRAFQPSLEAALAIVDPQDREEFASSLYQIRDDPCAGRVETTVRIRRANDGAERCMAVNIWKTVKADSPAGRILMTFRDVTDEKHAEERIKWAATHDPLTGLANRAQFQRKLDDAIRQAGHKGAVGLLMLDLDHFKQVNDSLGHDAGDELLQVFARRLECVTRAGDTVARLGGDEFAIILQDVRDEDELAGMAQSLLDRTRDPFVHAKRIIDCRASIGASLYPGHGRTPCEMMKHADLALYASKSAGRATSTVFNTKMQLNAQKRDLMLQMARGALRDDRVIPYYQPKVDLGTGEVTGFEALLRWRTKQGRIKSPASIGAAFEDLDVANAISDCMIEKVIADMRVWLDNGVRFRNIAVNASAAEFRKDDFAERVLEQLARAGIAPQHFELEVTETVFLGRGAENVHRALKLLNKEGVSIALDDFGTGYASLRHLKHFPVDTLKIDCSFVRDMLEDVGDEAIIRAVINLGRSLSIKVVAEGIETNEQAEHLMQLNCDVGQGFLFAKAVPASRVPALVSKRTLLPKTILAGQNRQPPLRLVAG